MGKKKHAEEHENLERWLVSYADFITLLFATFVVLYALSQSDIESFKELENSIQKAFSRPSLLQGGQSIMSSSGQNMFGSSGMPDSSSFVPPSLEFLSPNYEKESFKKIKEKIEEFKEKGDLDGVEVKINERGLEITLADLKLFFGSGSAKLKKQSHKSIEKISALIKEKFSHHYIRVEGHSDNQPIKSDVYPSNWELSSARASSVVRYMINELNLKKELFAAVGYSDTKPIASNKTKEGRFNNRRVSIIVLKNVIAKSEPKVSEDRVAEIKHEKNHNREKNFEISPAVKNLAQESGIKLGNVLIIKDQYEQENQKLKNELARKEQHIKEKYKNATIVVTDNQSGQVSSAALKLVQEKQEEEKQDYMISHKKVINIDPNKKDEDEDKHNVSHKTEKPTKIIGLKQDSEKDILIDILNTINNPINILGSNSE